MPHYEYLCVACNERFTRIQTLNQHDHESISCPKCGSKNIEQAYSSFYAVTTKKSA
jgi:putative FmdB family regulatory protein